MKVDLLVDRNECLGMETQVVFVYGEGELVCEACFSGSSVIEGEHRNFDFDLWFAVNSLEREVGCGAASSGWNREWFPLWESSSLTLPRHL